MEGGEKEGGGWTLLALQAGAYWVVDRVRFGKGGGMGCCKCNGFFTKWSDPQPTVFKDEEGKEFCLFHAPVGEKRAEMGGPILTPREFERAVTSRIKKAVRSDATECDFRETIFPHYVSLSFFKKEQLPKIMFDGCKFHDVFLANDIFFQHGASFAGAKFDSDVFIWRSSFGEEVDFSGAVFDKKLYLYRTTFSKCARLNSIKCQSDSIEIEAVTSESLGNCVFDSQLVRCIQFRGICDWPDKLGLEHHQSPPRNMKDFEELYRAMKQRAAEAHDQPQVSHWHFREKLMAMKRGGNGVFEAVMLWLYWATSGFGERAVRAGMWLLALLLIPFLASSPVGAWLSSFWATIPYSANIGTFAASVRDSVNATAAVGYIPFMKDTNGPSGWLKVGQALWQGVILLQFTLFALAVRNRFRR